MFFRQKSLAILVVACLAGLAPSSEVRGQYSKEEIETGKAITRSIVAAERAYFEKRYDQAGESIRKGMNQLHDAMGSENPKFREALEKLEARLDRVHVRTEIEGVSLPPFRLDRLVNESAKERGSMGSSVFPTKPAEPDPTPPPSTPPTSPPMDATLVSFTRQVGPILNQRCGRCHIQSSRGRFNLGTFANLMKGPPEGVVVFAKDVIGSRLIETIETGDMPRGGGKVTAQELKTLKDWIMQGAKFDGANPNAPISGSAPAPTTDSMMPEVKQATGSETVSFVSQIAPLLVDNCSGCHIDAMQTRGGLRMDTFAQLLRGGDSGAIVTPGQGEQSLLVKKLRGTAADGERMPAGGKPALSDDSIALVSKWIDEGATIDGEPSTPIKVLSRLAWVASATSEEVTQRRAELAQRNITLANSTASVVEHDTDHFHVIGDSSEETLQLVGRIAEQHLKIAKSIARAKSGSSPEDYFHGKSTIFVMPKRYDYSEFSKMVERRSLPGQWTAHWHSDGEDAYLAAVASERDTEEDIETRLLSPVVSLAIATRGPDVPRWFAEGIGGAISMQQNAKSRSEKEKLQTLAFEAAQSVKNAKAYLDDKLTPEQSDSFGAALALSMLDRSRRKNLETCLRSLGNGKPFDQAFVDGFGVAPVVYIDQFLQFVR